MDEKLLIAIVAALPGILAGLAALLHSRNTRRLVTGAGKPQPSPSGPARANR